MAIKLTIDVVDITDVLQVWNQIKVFKAPTISGTYAEVTTAATRIALKANQTEYEFVDPTGISTDWYKVAYYNSITDIDDDQSEPQLGADPATDNILTVQQLKDVYLIGIDLTDDKGAPYPDLHFAWSIRWAIDWVEALLDIRVRETPLVQRYDYVYNDYVTWTVIPLREKPIVQVNSVSIKWPSDQTVLTFPAAWLQTRLESGVINVVPASGSLSQVLLTAGGAFLPLLAGTNTFVPNIIEVDFVAGFAQGQVPMTIRDLIGKFAAFGPLNVAGDLIVGAGIASKSISFDGLSQSINTTSSATNAGYGARIQQYEREIKRVIPILRKKYKGIGLTVA
jgi:hypothetical protein